MKKSEFTSLNLCLVVVVLLLINFVSAHATYEAPSSQEQSLFSQLLSDFEKTDVPKKDVSDVIDSFGKPLVINFPCNSTDTNNFVIAVITTRLAKFDATNVHEDQVIGGTYTWDCLVTSEAQKVTLQCNNELRLNSNVLLNGTGVDPTVHHVENEVVLYHEFLHGQLMIDAIKSSAKWRHEVCNKTPDETIDYSYADPDHILINPLQSSFASQLMEQQGGEVITKYLLPNETRGGYFDTTIFKISDFPQFRNGGEVTLRAVNIDDTKFGASNNIVFLNGTLVNKTEPGIAWFYISGAKAGMMPQGNSSLLWEKRIAGLWANGHVTDSYFYNMVKNMTGQQGAYGEQFGTGKIPYWIRNTANWWFEGRIDDSTFLNLIQYLVSNKII
ncbi:MAG: hypothetical protein KGI25_04165 [Thaumarchaeota archaeon]|nr:hypothetical protein [Nitrososphaerota archaeon]